MRYIFLVFIILVSFSVNAQVADDFSDGNFTADPAWGGDIVNFEVDEDSKLHLVAPAEDAISIIYTESQEVDDVIWEFDVEMDFNPSGTSLTKAYLVSNSSDFNGTLQGYYVMIGDSEDEVSLYRQDGVSDVKIIDGLDDFLDASSVGVTVRVTRTGAGEWELFRKQIAQENFVSEGSTNDLNYTMGSYFGFSCKYIASRSEKFFFDNISVGSDTSAPSLSSINVEDQNTLTLFFSESMDASNITDVMNYSVNNGIGFPESVTILSSQSVSLSFVTDFVSGTTNTLSITNLQDLAENVLNEDADFTYILVVMADEGDVLFNEIMADPTGDVAGQGIPDVEYVEFYNTSESSFDLEGWSFVNTNTAKILPTYILQPNAFVIVCDDDDVSLLQAYGDCIGISSFTALSNGGDSLTLLTNEGIMSDVVSYDESWYNVSPIPGGFSIELINPFHPCSFQSNWRVSAALDGGTPGAQNSVFDDAPDVTSPVIQSFNVNSSLEIEIVFNEVITEEALQNVTLSIDPLANIASVSNSGSNSFSVVFAEALLDNTLYSLTIVGLTDCSGNEMVEGNEFTFGVSQDPEIGDVLINELMADPTGDIPEQGIPDVEYVELYNTSGNFYNLDGWDLKNDNTSNNLPFFILHANAHVIICDLDDVSALEEYGVVIGLPSFSSLTNGGDNLTLLSNNDILSDAISYDESWYNVSPIPGGVALERINPFHPCSFQTNWSASTASAGGTPGAQNSVFDNSPDVEPPVIQDFFVISNMEVQVVFNEVVTEEDVQNAVYVVDPLIEIESVANSTVNSINIVFTDSLLQSTFYEVTINGLVDCSGNELVDDNGFTFGIPQIPEIGDVIINEILFDPNPDGEDFVELYNNSDKILSLSDLGLTRYDDDVVDPAVSISSQEKLFFPRSYMVITEDKLNILTEYPNAIEENVFQTSFLPSYNNDESDVILVDGDDNVFEVVSYDEDWHFELLDDTEGVSLERRRFDGESNSSGNWHSASENSGFATPGYVNSQFSEGNSNAEIDLLSSVVSPDNDGFQDVIDIQYKLDEPGFVANIQIVDDHGRLVSTLTNNELLGIEGVFSWDGVKDDGTRAPMGIYIVLIEIFDLHGTVEEFKRVITVASKL